MRPSLRSSSALLLLLSLLAVPVCRAQSPPPPAALPTADAIMERSIEVTGGRAAWTKVTSLHMKGEVRITEPAMTGTLDMLMKAPNKMLECIDFNGMFKTCRGYDGTIGWEDSTQSGLVKLDGKKLDQLKTEAEFNSDLTWKTHYKSVVVTGESDFNGDKVYTVVMENLTGKKEENYFSKASGLRVGSKELDPDEGEPPKVFTFLDYQTVAGVGVRLPARIAAESSRMTFTLLIHEYSANQPVPDSQFVMPAPPPSTPSATGAAGNPEDGRVIEGGYQNNFFGFRFDFPKGWVVHGEETRKALAETGEELFAGDNEVEKSALRAAHKRSYNLLAVFEFPFGTPDKKNRGLQLVVENIAFAPGIKDGKDYLAIMQKTLASSQLPMNYVGTSEKVTYDGVDFYRQDIQPANANVEVYEVFLVTVQNGYAICFVYSAHDKSGAEDGAKSLSSFHKVTSLAAKP